LVDMDLDLHRSNDAAIRKRDNIKARKLWCTIHSKETLDNCRNVNEIVSSVNKYCSDNKNKDGVKQGVNWIANMVG